MIDLFAQIWSVAAGQSIADRLPKPRRRAAGVMAWLASAAVFVTVSAGVSANAIYVDDDAPLGGDGTSWATAFRYLQNALSVALPGDDIRVAGGTYRPDQDEAGNVTPGNRAATFQLLNGVALLGGYAGFGAPDPNLRDIALHESILGGDLAGNDVYVDCVERSPDCDGLGELCADGSCIIPDQNAENSYHVVTGDGTYGTAILDGFTITGGNANGPYFPLTQGGGMINTGASPTVTNCTFSGNTAGGGAAGGGGMSNEDGSVTVTNCVFRGNSADLGGGMDNVFNSSPTVTDCTFIANSALAFQGGGMNNGAASNPTVTNCTFSGNTAASGGGGMSNVYENSSTVINCIFNGNHAFGGGGMENVGNSNPTVTNCTFSGNSATQGGGGMRNITNSSPTVYNCTFSANSTPEGGGMQNFFNSNPTVTNCTFSGNSVTGPGGGMSNGHSSSPTVTNCTFGENSALFGGGVYNWFDSNPLVTNGTFTGNCAAVTGGGMHNSVSSRPVLTNSIFWQNSDGGGTDESAQIHDDEDSASIVNYSDVQRGWTGAGGIGNIDADPLFVDADGPDGAPGTEDDNLRLLLGSPCIDAGDNSRVIVPTDLDGNMRIVDGPASPDCPQAPGTCGTPPIVDMGAYEFGSAPCGLADLDCDGDVDLRDFGRFQGCFGVADPLGCNPIATPDLDGSGQVDLDDYAIFVTEVTGPGL